MTLSIIVQKRMLDLPDDSAIREAIAALRQVPIFLPENASLPIPATVLFVFQCFIDPVGQPLKSAAVGELFSRWWASASTTEDGRRCINAQGDQIKYHMFVKRKARNATLELRAYGELYQRNIMVALVPSEVLPTKQGTIFTRQLKPAIARLAFFRGVLPEDRIQGAKTVWELVCRQQERIPPIMRLWDCARSVSNLDGHIDPSVSNRYDNQHAHRVVLI